MAWKLKNVSVVICEQGALSEFYFANKYMVMCHTVVWSINQFKSDNFFPGGRRTI